MGVWGCRERYVVTEVWRYRGGIETWKYKSIREVQGYRGIGGAEV